jgi:hypothetical protein
MAIETLPLPGLVGGVSQQIAALRHPTQCTEQENGLATLLDGLYKRPGSQHIAVLPLTGPNGASVTGSAGAVYGHVIDRGSAGRFQLALVNGNMMLYNLDSGAVQTVAFPDGLTYLAASDPTTMFRCLTVADTTFIANTSKTVAMQAAGTSANPVNVAYISVRESQINQNYVVTVDGVTGFAQRNSEGMGGYNAAGVAQFFTTGMVANQSEFAGAIRQVMAGLLGGGYTVTQIPGTTVVKIVRNSGAAINAFCFDSWNGNLMRAVHLGVDTFAELPARFETGYTVTINGSADNTSDPYYVKWTGSRWEETHKPALETTFNATTMPHKLVPLGDGTWTFQAISDWVTRKVGDDTSNPKPSFVGTAIRGMAFFRNRLMFLSQDSAVLSRPGDYFNFFASSATQVLATDPIDLASPVAKVNLLEWAEPFNEDLVIWTDQAQQLRLKGGDVLTSETARLVPATTFNTERSVQPIGLGNRALFADTAGGYSRLSLYRVSADTVTNTADDITEHVPSYVPALPRKLVGSTTSNMLAVLPSGLSKAFKVFRYTLDDEKLTQKAWQNFTLETNDDTRFIDGYWVKNKLYLLTHVTVTGDSPAGGRLHLSVIDFEPLVEDLYAGVALRLDNRVLGTPVAFDGTNTTVDVPYLAAGQLTYVKCVDGLEPQLLTPVASVNLSASTRATLPGNQMGATIWVGRPFTFRYVFTEFVFRNADGIPQIDTVATVKKLLLRYTRTGYFKAKVQHLQRALYQYEVNGHTVGMPGQGATDLALSSGDYAVPVHGKPAGLEVSIESTSVLPLNIPYAEWSAAVMRRARRR